jgi:hypothetical protein
MLVSGFSYVNWVGCLNDRQSTGGFPIFLGSNLVSWSAHKQPTVSRSSTEVQYKALVNATAEIMWVHTLLNELGLRHPSAASLWCDNHDATYLSVNPIFHARTKHIKVDYHLIRERVAKKLFDIWFISTNEQVAHGFTKALSCQKMHMFQFNLNLGRLGLTGC